MNERKVLLIDDEVSLQRSLALGLMQKGYQTEARENGMSGLLALESQKEGRDPYHYVVVDVRLPDFDGIKLLKVIKHNYPDLPVVVITGYGNETIAADAKSEKADGFLEKPFTAEELSRILSAIPAKKTAPAPVTQEDHEMVGERSVSAYVLLSFSSAADQTSIYQDLYFMDQMLYCDAIKGDFDLVLLLQANTLDEIKALVASRIQKLAGLQQALLMPVGQPKLSESVAGIIGAFDRAMGRDNQDAAAGNVNYGHSASSYVFLEIEKEKQEQVYSTLYVNDQVVSCDCVDGPFDIALLMQGASFAEIDRSIKTKIKPLDGVLRIKEMPIIKLFEM
jgi:CheY-like chemotaxis protein